ncbi:MAG: hypothetical protein PW788_08865 [Micavibrio sp.]|nr:hypothetical protein [Micavibrio sp.]
MADITPQDNNTQPPEPPVTSSTPDAPGMKAAIDTLQPGYFKPPSKVKMLMAELMDSVIREIPFNIPLVKLALNNLTVVPTTPEALVTALPFVQNLRINRAFGDISSIPEGRDLVNMVQSTGAQITIAPDLTRSGAVHKSRAEATDGQWVTQGGPIELTAFNTHGSLTATLVHELQHRKQMLGGVIDPLNSKIPSPIESLWYDRAIEADAEATAIDLSYKMSKAGKPAAWDHLQRSNFSPHAVKGYKAAIEANPNALQDGTAKRAAFDGWFQDSKNKNEVDLSRVYNGQGLSKWIGEKQIENLAGGGKPLAPLTHDDMAKIGALSEKTGGVNYLSIPGGRALTDEFYRRPNWNQWQAQQLAGMQRSYEDVKARLPGAASNFMQNNGPATNPTASPNAPSNTAQIQLASLSQDRLKAAIGLTRPAVQTNTAAAAPVVRASAAPRK